jgi:hypothetical protein
MKEQKSIEDSKDTSKSVQLEKIILIYLLLEPLSIALQ